ncbi:MAG TPA: hypothetical protein VGZ51_01140, partial [Actinomycetota bacterium]|nr:hypothetical protein [Actinomycetota bacterium]
MSEGQPANRRIDRIRDPSYIEGIDTMPLEDVRARRDESMAEREYLSLLRRLVQGRAEILKAELASRSNDDHRPLVDRLSEILASDQPSTSRGECSARSPVRAPRCWSARSPGASAAARAPPGRWSSAPGGG